uniref:Uncharacterized protein n=1 Tax=Anguilla anguilla TaxID=7936 RepID=A0A0E9XUQ1_ANGAN
MGFKTQSRNETYSTASESLEENRNNRKDLEKQRYS